MNTANLILLKKNERLVRLSQELGFSQTFFLEDIKLIKANTPAELLKELNSAGKKLTIYKPSNEKMLRFALEKSKVKLIYGLENLHLQDSPHYVRGGLDQVACRLAAEKDKIIAFSFSDILNSKQRSKLLARMALNIRLCQKYKVQFWVVNLTEKEEEVRSQNDLEALLRVLKKPAGFKL